MALISRLHDLFAASPLSLIVVSLISSPLLGPSGLSLKVENPTLRTTKYEEEDGDEEEVEEEEEGAKGEKKKRRGTLGSQKKEKGNARLLELDVIGEEGRGRNGREKEREQAMARGKEVGRCVKIDGSNALLTRQ